MTPLPPQTPEVPPRYRFRVPNDRGYIAPPFRAPMTPRVTFQPYEPNEPRDLEWDELTPEVIVGGFAMFVAMCAIVVIVFLSSVA